MPLQAFTITADVPDGYEPTGEYRKPKAGEYINFSGIRHVTDGHLYGNDYVILRPVWKWPEFVKPGCWIAMDKNGNWAFYDEEPHITLNGGNEWLPRGAAFVMAGEVANFFNFTPPPCTDWKLSKRQKPL